MNIRFSLIIGFGRAGRGLHLTALKAIGFAGHVGVLDITAKATEGLEGVTGFDSLSSVPYDKTQTVVHLCDPPSTRADTLRRVLAAGYRHIIVEKPLSTLPEDADRMCDEVAAAGANVLVVSNWLFSALTSFVLEYTERRKPDRLLIEHNKQRIPRTISNSTHESGFDVELPHLFALAQSLVGELDVTSARASDLQVDGHVYPGMARAEVTAASTKGALVTLRSHLCAPISRRLIVAEWDDGTTIEGYYPTSGAAEQSSQVRVTTAAGRSRSAIFEDNSLRTMIKAFYRAFETNTTGRPSSGLPFHTRIVHLLSKAKQLSREVDAPCDRWSIGAHSGGGGAPLHSNDGPDSRQLATVSDSSDALGGVHRTQR